MNTSIFLAKIIGPYCLVAAVGLYLNKESYQKYIEDFLSNVALRLFGGMFALIIGLLMVNTHNVWDGSWRVIITIFGWISLTKGVSIFCFPNKMNAIAQAYQKNNKLLRINLIILFLLGLFLALKGYFS